MDKNKTKYRLIYALAVITLGLLSCSDRPVTQSKTTTLLGPEVEQSVSGIDVSHFQGDVNWEEVKAANFKFAYTKATQGIGYIDSRFKINEIGAAKSGLPHGAYHFYIAGDDPLKQAQLFVKMVQDQDDRTLPPVLDLEQGGMKPGISPKTFQEDVKIWLQEVEKSLNVKPIIYTNRPFGNHFLTDSSFAEYDLWIAEYGVEAPKVPEIWKSKGWLLWQRSDRTKIEGSLSTFDGDSLNGPFENLLILESKR